jgi:hypothetical protein
MSIDEYCSHLKRLADTLYDCGAAASNSALVINTLHSLNNKFSQAIAMLSTMTLSPTFLYTKSYLPQEENHIKHLLQMEAQTALLAAQDTGSSAINKFAPAPPPPTPTPASTTPPSGGGDSRKKRKAPHGSVSNPGHNVPHIHRSGHRRTIRGRGWSRRGRSTPGTQAFLHLAQVLLLHRP